MNSELCHGNCNNWAGGIGTLWTEFGLSAIFENRGSRYKHLVVKTLKQKMLHRYEHHWLAHVGLSPTLRLPGTKLRAYIQVKHQLGLENYLIAEKNFPRRQNMAKLRISAHPLRIESGRYCRPPLHPEQRVCQYCPSGSVESEEHFLLECSLYLDQRNKLFETLKNVYPMLPMMTKTDMLNFLLSMNGGDTEAIGPVLEFVSDCFEKRATFNT